MSELTVHVPAKRATLEAVVIRKDGSREELGTIAYWHQRRICRWLFSLERAIRATRQSWEK